MRPVRGTPAALGLARAWDSRLVRRIPATLPGTAAMLRELRPRHATTIGGTSARAPAMATLRAKGTKAMSPETAVRASPPAWTTLGRWAEVPVMVRQPVRRIWAPLPRGAATASLPATSARVPWRKARASASRPAATRVTAQSASRRASANGRARTTLARSRRSRVSASLRRPGPRACASRRRAVRAPVRARLPEAHMRPWRVFGKVVVCSGHGGGIVEHRPIEIKAPAWIIEAGFEVGFAACGHLLPHRRRPEPPKHLNIHAIRLTRLAPAQPTAHRSAGTAAKIHDRRRPFSHRDRLIDVGRRERNTDGLLRKANGSPVLVDGTAALLGRAGVSVWPRAGFQ